jgi:hypothetical protein
VLVTLDARSTLSWARALQTIVTRIVSNLLFWSQQTQKELQSIECCQFMATTTHHTDMAKYHSRMYEFPLATWSLVRVEALRLFKVVWALGVSIMLCEPSAL